VSLERTLDRLRVFNQHNVLFDADPNEALDLFAQGGYAYGHRQGLVHPALRIYVTAPVKLAAAILTKLPTGTADAAQWRRRLTMLLAPVAAAFFYFVFFQILWRLGFSLGWASLGTILALVSFGQLLFGSVPESYAVSNLAIAAAFYLLATPTGTAPAGRNRILAWLAVALFATGVTITNIVPVAAIFWLDEMARGARRLPAALGRAIGLAVAVLAIAAALNVMANRAPGLHRSLGQEVNWADTFVTTRPRTIVKRIATFPSMLVDAIAAPMPKTIGNDYAVKVNPSSRYDFQFTFDSDGEKGTTIGVMSLRNLSGVVLLAAFLWPWWPGRGVWRDDRERAGVRAVSGAALLILAFNLALHSFWGLDRFLYSQHWEAALALLVAAMLAVPLRGSRWFARTAWLVVLAIAVNNISVLHAMITRLRLAP
jgi:hypothetical protein